MSCIKIDKSKCKSCYLCISACPLGLIKKSSDVNSNGESIVEFSDNESKCLGCAQCATVCPDLAITDVIKSD